MATAPTFAAPRGPGPAREDDDRARREELLERLLLEKYEPIAVVGMGLRFPGGNDTPEGFAEFLRAGQSGIGPIPRDRWDVAGFASDDATERGKVRTAGGGFVEGFDRFDPKFFNISPKEAQYIDPQQRLVLETSWEALENANIDPSRLRGRDGGVYVGASSFDYALEVGDLEPEDLEAHVGTGTAHSAVPGRVSYFFGWRGPSIAIDTACSSSLVGLHLAVEGLRRRECEFALCGAVTTIHHPRNHIVFSQANMLAPDGRCKTFDDKADGYARSEGCAMVVLKRLSDAKRDGDTVLALVRGCAVRQDGESGGLTVPSGSAQEAVMRAALAAAMVRPQEVQYVEAHGTGTSLGDPIELAAINAVFGPSRSEPLLVGSLKTNLGHMEPAAGIGGVIKTVLQLRDGEIYPHLNLEQPSRHIPWSEYRLDVPTERRPWPGETRRAVVNSFGFAGTLAAAVLEQPPVARPQRRSQDNPDRPDPHIFTLSAKTPKALGLTIEKYQAFLAQQPDDAVDRICYTSNVGRAHFTTRLAGVVRDRDGLSRLLAGRVAELDSGGEGVDGGARRVPKIAMLFTGQGSQYAGMGTLLHRRHPVFRSRLEECDRLFAPYLGRSIADLVLGTADDPAAINQTIYTQPALFALEYALAGLWVSWGVEPDVLLGHSLGEVAAAAVAGLFPLEDAVRLVATRSRLMQAVSAAGGMAAVMAPATEVAPLLDEHADLALAALNTPSQCVVSGGKRSLAALVALLNQRGVRTVALAVSHAFHSPLMAEVFDRFQDAIGDIRFQAPDYTLISDVSGEVADPAELSTPEYWVRHIAQPVNFDAGMRAIEQRGRHAFLEIGPSSTLLGLGRQCVRGEDHLWLASLKAKDPEGRAIADALVGLYRAGFDLDWSAYHEGRSLPKVTLPTMGFDRRRYWLPATDERHSRRVAPADSARHPLLGEETTTPEQRAQGVLEFTAHIGPSRPRYLQDHVIMGQVVFPAAAYIELLLALEDAVHGETCRPLRDVAIHDPLLLSERELTEIRTRLRARPDGTGEVEIVSRAGGGEATIERRHATALIGVREMPGGELGHVQRELQAQAAACLDGAVLDGEELYAAYADRGLSFGPTFRRILRLTRHGHDVAVADVRGTDTSALEHLPPAVLDAVMQSLGALVDDEHTYLPVRFGCFQLAKKPKGATVRSVIRRRSAEAGEGDAAADMLLLDGDRPVFVLQGLGTRRVVNTGEHGRRLFHEPRWVKRSLLRKGGGKARHAVVVHARAEQFGPVLGRAGDSGLRVSFASDARDAAGHLQDVTTDVCWFWKPEPGRAGVARLRLECERNYKDLLELLRAVEARELLPGPRLWLVTEGAQRVAGDPSDAAADGSQLAAATLWGFGSSLLSERPTYRVTLLDLPPAGTDGRGYEQMLEELLVEEPGEFQVAYRGGHRHVRRIYPVPSREKADGNFELAVEERGELSTVRPVPISDSPPEGDDVQVEVRAAGLNFKDVLNALGLLDRHAEETRTEKRDLPLGFECSGTVVAAGPDAHFAVGDEVVVSALGSMRRRVTVPSAAAVRKPSNISFAEAAALPTAYITAYYALHDLAHLKAGDSVLIHAAAGGVGQAAVQLAKRAGARIFATASPGKWPLLRAQGVQHVLSSRTLDFSDEILRLTDGAGVDIVLNSLNKDYIAAGLRVLADGGTFVELGKIGVWTPEQVRAARPDVTYHSFDLSEYDALELLALNHRTLEKVVGLLGDGELAPLPTTVYSLDEVAEAFGVLSRGANVGKLVIDLTDPSTPDAPPFEVSPDETYLVSGGLGALGRSTARTLARLGARRIAVMSRRPIAEPEVAALERDLGEGVTVLACQGDVAEEADVERIVSTLDDGAHPLGAVFHAAGVLADLPVSALTWETIEEVFRPKVYGSWLLHDATRGRPGVRAFVGYSSIASVLGPAGQANYAAANAFIDSLMAGRRAAGLCGLSVNWGPWAGAGMAARLEERHVKAIESQGIKFLSPSDGTRALVRALDRGVGQLLVGEFDWDRVASTRTPASALFENVGGSRDTGGEQVDCDTLRALSLGEREAAVNRIIRSHLARLLHFDGADDIPPVAPFRELGLDSLAAVALRNSLESAFEIPLPTSVLLDVPSVDRVAELIAVRLAPSSAETEQTEQTEQGDPPPIPGEPWTVRDVIDVDAELEALRSL